MKTLWKRLRDMEPARLMAAIRGVVYILVGITGSWLSPENTEPILAAIALLLGVDVASTEKTRSSVTPTAKLRGKGPTR